MKYISADKLLAEIERQYRSIETATGDYAEGRRAELENFSKFIDSLQQEQMEVELEKELNEWMKYGPHTSYPWCTIPDAIKITAEHFYELGRIKKEE